MAQALGYPIRQLLARSRLLSSRFADLRLTTAAIPYESNFYQPKGTENTETLGSFIRRVRRASKAAAADMTAKYEALQASSQKEIGQLGADLTRTTAKANALNQELLRVQQQKKKEKDQEKVQKARELEKERTKEISKGNGLFKKGFLSGGSTEKKKKSNSTKERVVEDLTKKVGNKENS